MKVYTIQHISMTISCNEINSRSTTLLGAERSSTEEAVYKLKQILKKMKKIKRLVVSIFNVQIEFKFT